MPSRGARPTGAAPRLFWRDAVSIPKLDQSGSDGPSRYLSRAHGQPFHIPAGSPRRGKQGHLALAPRDADHDRPRHCHGARGEPVFRRRRPDAPARRRLRPQSRPLEARAPMAMRWYIVHAYSNFEKKVAESIREQAAHRGLADKFEEIMVPTEQVVEVRPGRKFN